MSYPQILLEGALDIVAAVMGAMLICAGLKRAIISGTKEVVVFYLEKKKEALEELEKKFAYTPGGFKV